MNLSSSNNCANEVKNFYIQYMDNMDHGQDNDSICAAHMAPDVITHLYEGIDFIDIDYIIRAQDVCRHGIQSLSVKELNNDWFMVSYKWSPDSDTIEIPLKAICGADDTLQILYITPLPLGNQYGDHLLQ